MTATTGTVVDARDGKVYKTVLMPDGKWWMAENLAWAGAGVERPEIPVAKHGRLYTYADIVAGCAIPGCHVPNGIEWNALHDAPGVTPSALKTNDPLWQTPGTNALGFNGIPSGQYWFDGVAWLFAQPENGWFCNSDAPYSWQPLWKVVLLAGSFDTSTYSGKSTGHFSVRLIIDSGNIPDPLFFFLGAPISGLERGYSASIDRHVTVREAIGGGVRLIPRAPAQSDVWTVDAEVMLTAAQAGPFEAAVGAYGSDSTGILNLPARGGASTFAGLAPAVAGADADTYIITAMRNPDAMGRRAVAVDLFAYRVQFDLIGSANAPIALTSTIPDWLPKKFATHSLRDSSQWNVYASPSTGLPTHPSAKVKHGRGQGHTIALDALDDSQADHLVAWYRNSRSAPVTITIDRGIAGQGAVSVYLVDLSLARDVGLHWSGSLEVVEA